MTARTLPLVLLVALAALVAGCRSAAVDEERQRRDADDGFAGLLHHADPRYCPQADGCGPEFSLLDESLERWTPLSGDLEAKHAGLVIRVDGKERRIDDDHRAWFGDAAADHAIDVKRYRLLSKIPYHPFLVEQAGDFTEAKYGCELLWDKSFRWREVEDRVELVVTMTGAADADGARPYLALAYDGVSGDFLREELVPWGVNPCGG